VISAPDGARRRPGISGSEDGGSRGRAGGRARRRTLSYRSADYARSLIRRVRKLELRVPQDRNGRFSTEIFERYERSEKALVAALTEMYIQGYRPEGQSDQ
jgi:putative transposase